MQPLNTLTSGKQQSDLTARGVYKRWAKPAVRSVARERVAEPGILDSGTTRSSGLFTRVWQPGGASVLLDVGTILVDEATGEVLASGGSHPFGDYFERGDTTALQPICDALAS